MSDGPNIDAIYRQPARFAVKLLKDTSAGEIPIEEPTKFELVINRPYRRCDRNPAVAGLLGERGSAHRIACPPCPVLAKGGQKACLGQNSQKKIDFWTVGNQSSPR